MSAAGPSIRPEGTTMLLDTPQLRRECLRNELPSSIDMLRRRRCSEIAPGFIDDYVALNWFEWHGGGLRVIVVGENICRQVVDRLNA
jgi:hypothetical protein